MPYKGSEVVLECGAIYTQDGEKLCSISEIPEFTCTQDPEADDAPYATINPLKEMSFEIGPIHISKEIKNLIMYGWTASGPIRKRLLSKLRWRYIKWQLKK